MPITLTPSQIRNILALVRREEVARDSYAVAPSMEALTMWTDATELLLAFCEYVSIDTDLAIEISDRRAWSIDAIIAFVQDQA